MLSQHPYFRLQLSQIEDNIQINDIACQTDQVYPDIVYRVFQKSLKTVFSYIFAISFNFINHFFLKL